MINLVYLFILKNPPTFIFEPMHSVLAYMDSYTIRSTTKEKNCCMLTSVQITSVLYVHSHNGHYRTNPSTLKDGPCAYTSNLFKQFLCLKDCPCAGYKYHMYIIEGFARDQRLIRQRCRVADLQYNVIIFLGKRAFCKPLSNISKRFRLKGL